VRPVATALVFLVGLQCAQAQQLPVFDVAVIKPADPSGSGSPSACCAQISVSANRRSVTISGITVRVLIQRAYNVFPSQVTGEPSWMDSASYAISAKADDGPPLGAEQFGPMLQRLLADRFALRLHRETKEFTVLSLAVAKSGPKLKEARSEALSLSTSRGHATATKVPMWMFATALGHYLDRPVVDDTGLKGSYNFVLNWTPGETEPAPSTGDNATPADGSGLSIFTALQEQLGLKLESKKGPLEVLVIDHVERPSEN
jgi:uncharacterized protein (TIGR03435 family)